MPGIILDVSKMVVEILKRSLVDWGRVAVLNTRERLGHARPIPQIVTGRHEVGPHQYLSAQMSQL